MANKEMLIRGRFSQSLNPIMAEINASITFDVAMYRQDIRQSIAHARMLHLQEIISEVACQKIVDGLKEIETEIELGQFEFSIGLEDIHMNIESRLKDKIGDVAGFLPTARSRNDQVATDLKMWIRDAQKEMSLAIAELIASLAALAEDHVETAMPGYTHLQPGQPVSFAHHLLCYVEMFMRDMKRIKVFQGLSDECPLGSAALAGTTFNINREFTALELGFKRPCRNSLDGVSDRDFALDHLYANSVTITHLSRLAEEIVLWMNPEFGFISLSDEWTTGSSIMPQKRNPDAAEIIRGKSGRIIGSLTSLLITLKGLALTFSKDMQEDKEPVFDSTKNLLLAIRAMTGMIKSMRVNREKMMLASARGYSTATDVADWLVQEKGLPFRTAHELTGKLVRLAEEKGVDLYELTLEQCHELCPEIEERLIRELTPVLSLGKRSSYGGTSPSQVRGQIQEIQARLEGEKL